MKIYNYSCQTFIWISACLLFLTMDDKSQATSSDTELRHAGAGEISAEPVGGDARLLVRRLPNLGNNVIVDLYIDGVAVLPIVYGQTYQGFIPAGRHVLSVVASPHAKWPTPTQLILNARKGETYTFTAMGDGSGQLILNGA